ncbi:threonine ammonia-lyase [Plasmodiophora brassicae]|uniref:threonine ammonia-lyase n=1 Tax=Plasmodiophora brassicae TaxID=37360 RepID=A0A0G4J6J2_PLABS|nr:hypothetical protein PBRA_002968 [Plasmodiophora brassicae]SPQ95450.1 unnamed protein product [Plasmodiophora brassicae]
MSPAATLLGRRARRLLSTSLPPDLTYRDVFEAHKRISQYVEQTPLDFSHSLSAAYGCDLFLKKEHVSRTGSYKERGALNKLLSLTDEEKARGVICSSAGNHAQAVSYHATRLKIDSVIVMPEPTPYVKVKATKSFGGRVVQYGAGFAEAYEKALEIAETENRTFVHAFNDRDVVAGQGTVALELLKQNAYLDSVIVPVGGGGLIAGMALVLKHINPRIKLYGVEAKAMSGMVASMEAGKVTKVPRKLSICDGIAIETVGEIPFSIINRLVDDIVLVEEDEVAASILTLLEKEKTVVEGSGATALAAIAYNHLPVKGQQVAAVTTGSNIDMTVLSRIIEKGLVRDGRIARISVTITDAPGQLAQVLTLIAQARANVRDIEHERAFLVASVQQTQPIVTIETRGPDHIDRIMKLLRDNGHTSVKLITPKV